MTVSATVKTDGYISEIYGGSNGGMVEKTNLTLLAGNYTNIYGGGKNDTVLGNTNVYVGGSVNSSIDVSDHGISERVFGGSNNGSVLGDTNITIADDAKSSVVYGGGNGADSIVKGSTNVTVNGGSVMGYYGGSYAGTVYNCNLVMNDGYVEQIFGGCQNTSMTGDTNITVNGGKVTRRIYGGCYNEADYAIFSGPDYFTDYFVNGNTTVTIGANANYTHSGSQECAISAGSRNDINHTEENATLKFENKTVYNNIKSYVGSSLMDVDGYDSLYVAGTKI